MRYFSVFDRKAEVFCPPYPAPTPGVAERQFKEAVNDPKTVINQNPEDFVLYEVFEFDDMTGLVIPRDAPTVVVAAYQLIQA